MESDFSGLGRPIRVLVADENAQNLKLLEEVCEGEGFEVTAVGRAEEVVAAATSSAFDLALLDAAPGLDGIGLCRQLRSLPATARMPVIIVTANPDDTIRDRAIEVGARGFLTKPFRLFELVERMRAALRLARAASDPPSAPHIKLRRSRAAALAALPSPSSWRGLVQKHIETCRAEGTLAACAIVRLEDESAVTAKLGRTATEAILGHAAVELAALVAKSSGGFVVRSEVDELLVALREDQLAAMSTVVARIAAETADPRAQVSLRWGALLASPGRADPDVLITGAREAVGRARERAEPGAVERLRKA